MSKLGDLREVIDGKHVMGTVDGLRDYHVAREVVAKTCRVKNADEKLARVKAMLKNYRVGVMFSRVTERGAECEVMVTENADGSGQYTIL